MIIITTINNKSDSQQFWTTCRLWGIEIEASTHFAVI